MYWGRDGLSKCGSKEWTPLLKGRASLVTHMVKNPPAMQETQVRS